MQLKVINSSRITGVNADSYGYFRVTLQAPVGYTLFNYKMSVYEAGTYTPASYSDNLDSPELAGKDWAGTKYLTFGGYTAPATTVDVLLHLVFVLDEDVSAFGASYDGSVYHT